MGECEGVKRGVLVFVRKEKKTNEEDRWPVERRDICECVGCVVGK